LDETFRDDAIWNFAGYFEAALKENLPAFLIALRDVEGSRRIEAASETELGRSPSIKALSEGNPQFSTVHI